MIKHYLKYYIGNNITIFYDGKKSGVELTTELFDRWEMLKLNLCLRPVSSITDTEYKSIEEKFDKESDSNDETKYVVKKEAMLTKTLIDLNIDVFNLIDQKLALNVYTV